MAASVYLYIKLAACFRDKKLSGKHCLRFSKAVGIYH